MADRPRRDPALTKQVPVSAKVTITYDIADPLIGQDLITIEHDLVAFVADVDGISQHGIGILSLLENAGYLDAE